MSELKSLGSEELFEYNERRRYWHANIGPLATLQMIDAHESLWEIVDSNRQDTGHARGAVAIDAYPGLGKTTIADSFGFAFHRTLKLRHGPRTDAGHDRIPVCRIGLTSNTTMRQLNIKLCSFYGHPGKTGSAYAFADQALDYILSCDTRLVIVDDVHFLNMRNKDGLAIVNHFKSLANEFPVTFLFVGVDLRSRGLMTEGLSHAGTSRAQTARRWTRIPVPPFEVTSRAGRGDWHRLLLGIEKNIVLSNSHPGMIADELSNYLFARSTGHIGSLMTLITRGCYRAMHSGEEALNADLMDNVRNDEASEQARLQLQSSFEQGFLTTNPDYNKPTPRSRRGPRGNAA
ncbi:MAG: AAA family ATPase [Rhodococcus qingshengii]